MERILDQKFIAGGYAVPSQDALNDIVQYCDNKNLKEVLYGLCNSVLDLICQINAQDTHYEPDQLEQLMNNFGGFLQPIIVRLEENFDDFLREKTKNFVNCYKSSDSYRQGIILTLTGMMYSLS
jgi:hypothetical protein